MKRILTLLAALTVSITALTAATPIEKLPRQIYSGEWKAGHIQGIAMDTERKHIYYSFTTMLVKADLEGNIIGTVTGLLGHLGCIEYNEADGRIYGSLEYKNDSIGKGILKQENTSKEWTTAFYVAIFDVDKIVRQNMSAEKDGIMTSVYLKTVCDDFAAKVVNNGTTLEHRYGCSGFDGITFGPKFGTADSKRYLTIAYGIYGDKNRTDNDYQVLLQYDTKNWHKYEQPLSQENMHQSGPSKPAARYFVHTGNTNWGVQNFEYDPTRNFWFLATYEHKKSEFADFSLFVVDGHIAPKKETLKGVSYAKKQKVLTLCGRGMTDRNHTDIRGWKFDRASTGIHAVGDNYFYISHRKRNKPFQSCTATLYRFVGRESTPFVKVE
ncbi:MAG: hypothetical protein IJX65_07540 [Alistipes sp.]|nr:hypothetical protein [Alistipes sp.]